MYDDDLDFDHDLDDQAHGPFASAVVDLYDFSQEPSTQFFVQGVGWIVIAGTAAFLIGVFLLPSPKDSNS